MRKTKVADIPHLRDQLSKLAENRSRQLIDYIERGIMPPSQFLRSMLANDFARASIEAGLLDANFLATFGRVLHAMPFEAWGSQEKIKQWSRCGGLLAYRSRAEKEAASENGVDNVGSLTEAERSDSDQR